MSSKIKPKFAFNLTVRASDWRGGVGDGVHRSADFRLTVGVWEEYEERSIIVGEFMPVAVLNFMSLGRSADAHDSAWGETIHPLALPSIYTRGGGWREEDAMLVFSSAQAGEMEVNMRSSVYGAKVLGFLSKAWDYFDNAELYKPVHADILSTYPRADPFVRWMYGLHMLGARPVTNQKIDGGENRWFWLANSKHFSGANIRQWIVDTDLVLPTFERNLAQKEQVAA